MKEFRFLWHDAKDTLNFKKHGIRFEEAKTVFLDENAIEFYDKDHSELREDRFLLLGMSFKGRLLMVCHCVREGGCTIRIINARKATKKEQKFYLR